MIKIMISEEKYSKKKEILGNFISLIFTIILVLIVQKYLLLTSTVASGSMEPTLEVGNTVFYNRLAYRSSEPERGDVVAFYSEEFDCYMAKRIIGLPGDHIDFKQGKVKINGCDLDESAYIDKTIPTYALKSFIVPEGHYFLMGDDRMSSRDSRFWENPYISKDSISGKYLFQLNFSFYYDIFMPLKNIIAA